MENKFLSRKLIITLIIMGLVTYIPMAYKGAGVSDTVVMAVLGILAAVGAAYKALNVKETKLELENKAKEIAGSESAPSSNAQ
jgi:hypothetical protein